MKDLDDKIHEVQLQTLEMKISHFLRVGVLVAGGVMLLGWILTMAKLNIGFTDNPYSVFTRYQPLPLQDEVRQAYQAGSWPILISYLGLVFLISLPMIRVLLTMILFFRQKEKILGGIALFVLVALIISMLLGLEL